MSNFITSTLYAIALGLTLQMATTSADTVYVPIGQQAADKQSILRPQQGMTKTQVEKKFGAPNDWRAAVGEPPISSWVYDDFTVYFEHDYVIHSVLTSRATN